jgi:CHAT domain
MSSLWQRIFSSSSVRKEKEPAPQGGVAQASYDEPEVEQTEVTDFSVAHLNIKDMFPEDVAVLHVQMEGKDMFRLVGANRSSPLDARQQGRPPSLAKSMLAGPTKAQAIRRAFIDYSQPSRELRSWLFKLLKKYGDRLKLIIVDHTHFEIPWELIDLGERQFIGAMVPTTRWLQTFTPEADERYLTVAHDVCEGRTLSCYLYQEVDHTAIEFQALKKLESQSTGDLFKFFGMLRKRGPNIGMVLISSHAFFVAGTSGEISVGSQRSNRLSLSDFRENELRVIEESRPVVFLNGCDSARVTAEDERFISSYRQGFPELFLGKGARGFIGTLAPVDDLHAAEFARDFIDKTLDKPDLPVAAILKELRAEAVATLPTPAPSAADVWKFLNTFMYVYYGNPLTSLRLAVKEA